MAGARAADKEREHGMGGHAAGDHSRKDDNTDRSRPPEQRDASEKLSQELNKPPLDKLPGKIHNRERDDESRGISTLPRCSIHGIGKIETRAKTGERSRNECEVAPPSNSQKPSASTDQVDKRSPYVDGPGVRDTANDPELRPFGHLLMNADKTGDNSQLMKTVRGMTPQELRFEFQSAQSAVNRDLGNFSIRTGVDDHNVHLYFKKTDLTLPYDPKNDIKQRPDLKSPEVRNDILKRVESGSSPDVRAEAATLGTTDLAMFDAISRSDGLALRSVLSTIKTSDELDQHFQNIAAFARKTGLNNWGSAIWANDLKSLSVYNGAVLFSGKFPISEQ
jgi:hypothetical protein